MKTVIILIISIFVAVGFAAEKKTETWDKSGELSYSFVYARTWMGHQMRKNGWKCQQAFTAGKRQNQEHSVWRKGNKKMQIMLWRIDANKTGYAQGEIK